MVCADARRKSLASRTALAIDGYRRRMDIAICKIRSSEHKQSQKARICIHKNSPLRPERSSVFTEKLTNRLKTKARNFSSSAIQCFRLNFKFNFQMQKLESGVAESEKWKHEEHMN